MNLIDDFIKCVDNRPLGKNEKWSEIYKIEKERMINFNNNFFDLDEICELHDFIKTHWVHSKMLICRMEITEENDEHNILPKVKSQEKFLRKIKSKLEFLISIIHINEIDKFDKGVL